MIETAVAAALIAIALRTIFKSLRKPDGIVRWASRGDYQREINGRSEKDSAR